MGNPRIHFILIRANPEYAFWYRDHAILLQERTFQ